MARPWRIRYSGAKYHVTVRGNGRHEVFHLLTMSHGAREAKKVALELSCRYSHQSQRKVGEHFGYKGNGAVLNQRQRLKEMLIEDDELKRKMIRIEKQILKS